MPVFQYPDGHVVLHDDPMWRGQQPSLWETQVTNGWKGTSNDGQLRTNREAEDEKELLVVCESPDNSCLVANDNRISCGNLDETQCLDKGCCFESSTSVCYFNARSSPFYSLRTKWSHDSNYLKVNEDTFHKKPEMPCEICSKEKGWKGYNIDGHTICHNKPTSEGTQFKLNNGYLVIIQIKLLTKLFQCVRVSTTIYLDCNKCGTVNPL